MYCPSQENGAMDSWIGYRFHGMINNNASQEDFNMNANIWWELWESQFPISAYPIHRFSWKPSLQRVIRRLAPEIPPTPQTATVADCFKSPSCSLPKIPQMPIWIPYLRIACPLISPMIWTWYLNPRTDYGAHATRVTYGINGHYFWKHTTQGGKKCVTREVQSLLPLDDLGVAEKIRIKKLHGYIQ